MRGLNISLLKAEVPHSDVVPFLKVFRVANEENIQLSLRDATPSGEAKVKSYLNIRKILDDAIMNKSEHKIKLKGIYVLIRLSNLGDELYMSGNDKYEIISNDDVWDGVLEDFQLKNTITSIDGKYRFNAIEAGSYLLYARYISEHAVVEWCLPVSIEQPGEVSADLFNDTAMLIYNKED